MRPLLPLLDNIRRATSAKAERMLRWRPRSREDAISRHRGESHQVRDRENGRSVGPSRSTSAGIGDRKWRAEQDSNLRPPGFPSFRPTNGILVQQHARLQSLRGCALCTDKLVRPSLVHRHRIVAGGAAVTIKTDHRPSVREPIADVRRIETCVCPGRLPTPIDTTGAWVAIGFFGDAESHGKDLAHLNCAGLKRGAKYEQGMVIVGYSIETHFVGTLDRGHFRV